MFKARCLPILIGSLPVTDHEEAVRLILSKTPEIPLWPQLPSYPKEGMERQFLTGFPGLKEEGKRSWIDMNEEGFEEEMTSFYTDYMLVEEDAATLQNSRFGLDDDRGKGFSVFLEVLREGSWNCVTLKGQITGPVTIGIGIKDQDNRGIFYNDNLRDMLVKLLALKGRWQVEELKPLTGGEQPIVFIDEPGMVSFGSSAFLGISEEMVTEAVAEVIGGIHAGGGLAGVHICANGDWGPVLSSNTDIISFDAYFFFENIILFKEKLMSFLKSGGILAWGIIPTGDPEVLEKVDADILFSKFKQQMQQVASFGIPEKQLMEQTFIAPSCGTGSLSLEMAMKVLSLTAEVSTKAQELYNDL